MICLRRTRSFPCLVLLVGTGLRVPPESIDPIVAEGGRKGYGRRAPVLKGVGEALLVRACQ